MPTFSNALKGVSSLFGRVEKWVIVSLLSLLVVFSFLQIILRNFFSSGLLWGDDFLRHGVLWISLLGAARATAESKHIRIDLLPRLMPARGRFVTELVCTFFSCVLSLILLWASWRFVQGERLAGGAAFASIPYWTLELIFPFSFALMALRFGINLMDGLRRGPERVET